jgi:hypothetical protein
MIESKEKIVSRNGQEEGHTEPQSAQRKTEVLYFNFLPGDFAALREN